LCLAESDRLLEGCRRRKEGPVRVITGRWCGGAIAERQESALSLVESTSCANGRIGIRVLRTITVLVSLQPISYY